MNTEFKQMQRAQTKLLLLGSIVRVTTWLALVCGTLLLLRHFGII